MHALQNKGIFSPDHRNLGGRNDIINLYYNHKTTLENIKPKINSLQRPQQIPKKSKSPSLKQLEENNYIISSYRRINSAKGRIDVSKPQTYDLKNNLSKLQNKAQWHLEREHILNLNSCQRRIDNIGSFCERKKNNYDYQINPPRFFRKKNTSIFNPLLSNSGGSQQLEDHFTPRSNYYNLSIKQSSKLSKRSGPTSARNTSINQEKNKDKLWESIEDKVPILLDMNPETQSALKVHLINVIIDHRLYKNEDYNRLQELFQFKNSSLQQNLVNAIFTDIKNAFDNDDDGGSSNSSHKKQ